MIKDGINRLALLSILCFAVFACIGHFDSLISKTAKPSLKKGSITFILGEDTGDRNFYTLGEEFFRYDSVYKTEQIIKHVRSLEGLLDFLNMNKFDTPLSRIEVLVHGNVWSGLSAKIIDGGERAYPKELLRAVLSGKLPTLRAGVVQTDTEINFWGCGIGNNPILRIALDSMFVDEDAIKPQITASNKFVVFKNGPVGEVPKRVFASYWPYFFKRGYRPSESVISKAMQDQYPDLEKEWRLTSPEDINDSVLDKYTEQFHIPITCLVTYKDSEDRPDIGTETAKMNWVRSQPSLMRRLDELSIPIDKYKWTVNKIIHTKEDGAKVPAIKAIGMSTVLCFLESSLCENQS